MPSKISGFERVIFFFNCDNAKLKKSSFFRSASLGGSGEVIIRTLPHLKCVTSVNIAPLKKISGAILTEIQ